MGKSSKKSSVNNKKKEDSGGGFRQRRTEIALNERIKEQKCLYNISKLNELELSKEDLFRQVIRFVKKGFRIPKYTEAAIKYNGKLYKSTNYRKRKWHISSVSERIPDQPLELRVSFHNDQSGTAENPFYKEEEQLIDAIADLLSLKINQKDAEEKIRLSEQRFKGLIQEAVDMIAIVNRSGTFQYVSPSYNTILGYKPEKLMGTDIFDLIHPDDQDRVKKEFSDLPPGIKAAFSHYRMGCKDGMNIWMQSTGTDMTDDPAINGIVVNSIDITEKKQEHQHLKLLESVVTNSSDAVLIMESEVKDEAGLKIVYVNEAFTKMTGYSKDEVMGKNPRILQGANTNPEKTARLKNALRNYEPCEIETINYKKNGEEFWNSLSISPVADDQGNYTHWVAIERDVTARKNRELKLKELNRSLEEHARELAVSNAELEQFAFVASHDLQEPLRMVTSFLTQLENKYEDQLDEKGKKYIHFATDGARRMRQIILDLLEFSRVGRIDTKKSAIDMNQLLQEIVTIHRDTIEDTQASVTWETMPDIVATEAPIKQLMQNLIGNALKYQPEGNRPEVHVSSGENKEYWEFRIKDNGIGMREEYFGKIFNIFQRLHNKDTYSGTGVGLAICKKIVEGHGGEIRVESVEGEGTTIIFTIAKSLNGKIKK